MANSVLLDTSFLISLVDGTRTHHEKAKEFYKYFLDNKHPMILSSIATAEFCIKQPLTDLPLSNFRLLPFNIPDSYHISNLFESYFKGKGDGRIKVKDDFKLVSQASFNQITYFITEDDKLVNDIIKPLNTLGKLTTKPLFLPDGLYRTLNIPPPANSLFS
jgi:hypothetical protein